MTTVETVTMRQQECTTSEIVDVQVWLQWVYARVRM